MLDFFYKYRYACMRILSLLAGASAVLSGIGAYEEEKFGYYNYMHQPIVRETAIFFGATFIVGSFIPQKVYDLLLKRGQKKKKKSRRRRILKKRAAKKGKPDSLTNWRKW